MITASKSFFFGASLLMFKTAWANNPALVAPRIAPTEQYMATVQIAVQENNPVLLRRSQNLVLEKFNRAIEMSPGIGQNHLEFETKGNEVILTLLTDNDAQQPMQKAVYHMIESLNGRVQAYGRSRFYKTGGSQPLRGFLKVSVGQVGPMADGPVAIRSISATSVQLRDVLRELQRKLGAFSYMIPGECMNRNISWSFGEGDSTVKKNLDSVMSELATFLNLSSEKRNGTYIFLGACPAMPSDDLHSEDHEGLLTKASFQELNAFAPLTPTQTVYIPLMPLSR